MSSIPKDKWYHKTFVKVPLVLCILLLFAIWTGTLAWGSLDDYKYQAKHNMGTLAALSLEASLLYFSAFVVAISQCLLTIKCVSVQLRTWGLLWVAQLLFFFAIASAATGGILRTYALTHYKNDLITECTNLVTGANVNFRWSIWDLHMHETLSAQEAFDWCHSAWHHDSLSAIYCLVTEILLFLPLTAGACAYVDQLPDAAPRPPLTPALQSPPTQPPRPPPKQPPQPPPKQAPQSYFIHPVPAPRNNEQALSVMVGGVQKMGRKKVPSRPLDEVQTLPQQTLSDQDYTAMTRQDDRHWLEN